MPDKNIQIEGVGVVAFPDSMSDDDIGKVIQRQHPELSAAPPIAKPPLAPGLGNSFRDTVAQAKNSLPGSLIDSATNTLKGIQMGQQPASTKNKDGSYSVPPIANPIQAALDFLKPYIHPQESFANDPVSTTAAYAAPLQAITHPAVRATAAGAAKAAVSEVRPGLSNIDLVHPFRALPDLYDAAKNIVSGGKAGLRDFQGRGDIPDPGGPFRPNPNVVTKFGGPATPSGGTPTGTNPKTGWKPPTQDLTPPPNTGFPDPGEGFVKNPRVIKDRFRPNAENSGPTGAGYKPAKVTGKFSAPTPEAEEPQTLEDLLASGEPITPDKLKALTPPGKARKMSAPPTQGLTPPPEDQISAPSEYKGHANPTAAFEADKRVADYARQNNLVPKSRGELTQDVADTWRKSLGMTVRKMDPAKSSGRLDNLWNRLQGK